MTAPEIELDQISAASVARAVRAVRLLAAAFPEEAHVEVSAALEHAADLLALVHGLGGSNLEPTLRSTEAWERLADLPADLPLVIALGDAAAPVALLPVVDIDVWTSATGAGPMIRLITGSPR